MSDPAFPRLRCRVVPGVILAVFAIVASACSAVQIIEDAAAPSPPPTVLGTIEFPELDGEVIVGLVADLSGNNSDLEAPFAEQLTAAVKIQNEQGGILGDTVGLMVRDSRNDVDEAIDAVEDLIIRGANLIVVGCDAETVIPAASIATNKGVLVVSPCVTSEEFALDAGDLAFSFAATDRQQGWVMADHAIDVGAMTAITISDVADVTAFDQCMSFTDRFVFSGGAVTASIEYGDGGLPLADVGETVGQFVEPDLMVLCAPPADLRVLSKQLRADDAATPIMLGSEGDTLFWLQGQPDLSDVWFVSSSSLYGLRSAADTEYIRALSPAPSGSADLLVSASFVAFAKAAEATGALDGVVLADHLRSIGAKDFLITSAAFTSESGIGGNTFTPQGLAIVSVTNGFPSMVTVLDPSAAPAPPPPRVATTLVESAPSAADESSGG